MMMQTDYFGTLISCNRAFFSHSTYSILNFPINLSRNPKLLRVCDRVSVGRKDLGLWGNAPTYGISIREEGTCDADLRSVLELATDDELLELQHILFGPSYFSPLLKSISQKADVEYVMNGDGVEGREEFIRYLESRFLFLAADARSTLRGWRPSYRNVLLDVRKKLNITCSSKLSTTDLEAEIFLHLLQEYSSEEIRNITFPWDGKGDLEVGISRWKMHTLTALRVGAEDIRSMVLKGGGVLTLAKIYQLMTKRLSGKMLMEAANYQIKNEILKKGGQLAAINLESRLALLAARQGFASAASRYLSFRSMMTLFGPLLWGTFLADVVIQMMGTDYSRILRAIYAFAQIRLTRTYGWTSKRTTMH